MKRIGETFMDVDFLVSKFEQEFKDDDYEKKEQLRREFVEKFPIESIRKMDVDNYSLGGKQGNLCWWLEYNTVELGSIKGGVALKHKIYYSVKEARWIFPKEFKNETEAWLKLREELYKFLKEFRDEGIYEVGQTNILYSMNMVRTKLLFLYYPEKLLPIYSADHIFKMLEFFGYKKEEIKNWDSIKANMELKKLQLSDDKFKEWNCYKFMQFLYSTVVRNTKAYKIAPGDNAKYWDECFKNGYICIGWDDVGDMRNYADYNEFRYKFGEIYSDYDKSKRTQKSNEMWTFFTLNAGDTVIANKGTSTILGVGKVSEKGYLYDASREEYKHIVYVEWKKDYDAKEITPQNYWAFTTVYEISEKLYKVIVGDNTIKQNKVINTDDSKTIKTDVDEMVVETFSEDEEKFFLQMDKNLLRKGNVILYGPPGTGKTFLSNRYLQWKRKNSDKGITKNFCTFHPSFNYEDFIEGYKPVDSGKGDMSFKLQDGIFKALCKKAAEHKDEEFYLIIDEINRGNVEKIFGEMITLIEGDKRGMSLQLSQSKEEFCVPQNVYIIGTMNTTDRSIKMLDAALRRRFAFIECMPDYVLIGKPIDSVGLSPKVILSKINARLREIEDREKQIGHSYFMKNGKQIETVSELREVYIYDIIPLISEYCFNDYSKMSEIIGEKFIDKDSKELKYELLNGTDDYFISEICNKFGDQND